MVQLDQGAVRKETQRSIDSLGQCLFRTVIFLFFSNVLSQSLDQLGRVIHCQNSNERTRPYVVLINFSLPAVIKTYENLHFGRYWSQ